MKTTKKMLNIMVLALALVCLRGVSQADPMGTAFTYQGRLMDGKKPANNIYDFQFALFDDPDPNLAVQVGDSLEANDVDVVDGHFTLALDFGSDVFDGNALWLETAVRLGDSTDPNDFVTLSPRQELTPVPYALQIRGIFVDPNGNVGIGTTKPEQQLDVFGNIRMSDESAFFTMWDGWSNRVAFKTASTSASGASSILEIGNGFGTVSVLAKLGIGMPSPEYNLDVSGHIRATGTIYGTVDNADKLDGLHASSFLTPASDFGRQGVTSALYEDMTPLSSKYLGISAKAANSDMVDGYHAGNSSGRVAVSNGTLCTNLNADKLDGQQGSYYRDWDNLTDIPPGFADRVDDIGGLTLPYSESVSSSGNAFSVWNTGSGVGIYGNGSNSSGVKGVSGTTTGVFGETASTSNAREGVKGRGPGRGVAGFATATSGITYGVYGQSESTSGVGVYGKARNTDDYTNYGGYFESAGGSGRAVYGKASNSGDYQNYGGYFEAAGRWGFGVFGRATSKDYALGSRGGYFQAWGDDSAGVEGWAASTSDNKNFGGVFSAGGRRGRGVYAFAPGSSAVAVEGYGGQYDFYAIGPGLNYGASSSIRWKRNIQAISNPLDKILRLRGVCFDWDTEHGGHHDVGMVAEEVGEVLPEIVSYEQNGIDASGMDYSKLTPLLVEAVKALKHQVDELRNQKAEKDNVIEALKQENDRLEGRLAVLESSIAKIGMQLEGGGI